MTPASHAALTHSLQTHGWAIVENFLPPQIVQVARAEILRLRTAGRMQPAAVGKTRHHESAVRGDFTYWLADATNTAHSDDHSPNTDTAQTQVLAALKELKQLLNRELFLGLRDVEAHYALYPPGAGYLRHLDSFRDNFHDSLPGSLPDRQHDRQLDRGSNTGTRAVSLVTYFNSEWQPQDGGELVLHLHNGPRTI